MATEHDSSRSPGHSDVTLTCSIIGGLICGALIGGVVAMVRLRRREGEVGAAVQVIDEQAAGGRHGENAGVLNTGLGPVLGVAWL